MDYTKADLRKFFLAGRRFGLLENGDNTPMNFNEFFDVYSQIQEDIKDQKDHLTEMMETDTKNGMYDQHKEQWRGIDMKRIEEMKERDEDKLNQPDKIKATIKKDSEAAKLVDAMKKEKQAFKEVVESGNNKQQTVVTWLINELIRNRLMALRYDKDNTLNEIIEQAKQMEKEQIKESWNDGNLLGRNGNILLEYNTGEQYYNETYGKE